MEPRAKIGTGRRFLWLDAARGIAAIAVMLYHYEEALKQPHLLHSAFLAVDLFFLMSGFVLAHAYEGKLRDRAMSFGRFVAVRLVRLYPVYLAGTLLGAAYYLAKIAMRTADAPDLAVQLRLIATAAFFVPNLDPATDPAGLFPFAPASWSLANEMAVSLLFAAILFRLGRGALAVIAALAFAIFLAAAMRVGSVDLGWSATTLGAGAARTAAGFVLGVLLYRVAGTAARPTARAAVTVLCLVTCSLIVLPAKSVLLPAAAILLLYPAFLLVQPARDPAGWAAWSCHQLGRISYPLYVLHTPVLLWVLGAIKLVRPAAVTAHPLATIALLAASSLAASLLLLVCIDEPLRAWASRRLHRRTPIDPLEAPGEGGRSAT